MTHDLNRNRFFYAVFAAALLFAGSGGLGCAGVVRIADEAARYHAVLKRALIVLSFWGLCNFAGSGILLGKNRGGNPLFSSDEYLLEYLQQRGCRNGALSVCDRKIEALFMTTGFTLFGLSFGLLFLFLVSDAAVVILGIILRRTGKRLEGTWGERLSGYGVSLILQTGFLVLFDAVVLLLIRG